MTEQYSSKPLPTGEPAPPSAAKAPDTAGTLLRAARESQGLHIAALAAAIKVSPRKLEALEADRYGELPDATFARALAQTICRHLKLNAQPVLALMPAGGALALEPNSRIHSTAFREDKRGSEREGSVLASLSPLIWLAGLLLIAAAAIYLLPVGWWSQVAGPGRAASAPTAAPAANSAPAAAATNSAPATAASAAALLPDGMPVTTPAPGSVASGVVAAPQALAGQTETVFAAPPPGSASAPVLSHALVVTTSEGSWLEVRDARGQLLLSETVQPGRSVGLDGTMPLRVLVGNAASTQLVFKGQPVDVLGRARGNVARFELQ